MGESYCILVWDDWGAGLVRVNPRLHAEGVDLYGNPKNDFVLEGNPTDDELIARHDLGGAHHQVIRPRSVEHVHVILCCPACHRRHVDEGRFATEPHRSHSCQSCGVVWKPALVPTVGVAFLPGCADEGAVFQPPESKGYTLLDWNAVNERMFRAMASLPDPPPPLVIGRPTTTRDFLWMVVLVVSVVAASVAWVLAS